MVIALGLVFVVLGINASVTGDDAQKLPKELESIHPVRNATQVQQQEQIQVDMIDGYYGELSVNGVAIDTVNLADISQDQTEPGAQVSLPKVTIFEPGNYTLTYTPADGAPVEEFITGINTATVTYWKITEGPNFAKQFTWQFDVI